MGRYFLRYSLTMISLTIIKIFLIHTTTSKKHLVKVNDGTVTETETKRNSSEGSDYLIMPNHHLSSDYHFIRGGHYWTYNGQCCRIPWTWDFYSGFQYCPPTWRCNQRSRSKPGALIIGGLGRGTTVEAFNPYTKRTCVLRRSPRDASLTTFCGGLLCGDNGHNSRSPLKTTCLKWGGSRFVNTTTVTIQPRVAHTCWELSRRRGILLLGGESSSESVEQLSATTASDSPGWRLYFPSSYSCGTEWKPGTFVITGGKEQENSAVVYTRRGFKKSLRPLKNGRFNHACGSFRNRGHVVMFVTGGQNQYDEFLASTEMYQNPRWKVMEQMNLPTGVIGARALTINNVAYLFGGRDITEEEKSQILYLKTKPGRFWEWEGAGVNMKSDRYNHVVGIIKDIYSVCD